MMSAPPLRERLQRDWYLPRRTLLTAALAPLEWLFASVVASRRWMFRRGLLRTKSLPVPVIVVGNLTVGGTGKTPLVMWLTAALMARGYCPGIVSRGYGAVDAGAATRAVHPDDDPDVCGDEPVLLAGSGHPVWIGVDRGAAARALLAQHPGTDVIISDDGLQHYALGRDCEIVVVDGARGFGNGALLPAGPLREPVSRIDHADAIVVNGPDAAAREWLPRTTRAFNMSLRSARFESLVDRQRFATAASFGGLRVHAVAGIGNPERFFESLRALGLAPVCHAFPDHHRFVAADIALPDADAILMTAKDAIKCVRFADARGWSLPVTAVVDAALIERILEKIDGPQAA